MSEHTWTVDEMWPAHAGHDIVYNRRVSTQHQLRTLITEIGHDGYPYVFFVTFDDAPCAEGDAEGLDDEYECKTCGEVLNTEHLWEPQEVTDGQRT